jgi:hypothetical protein
MTIENLLSAWNSIEWTPIKTPEYRIYYDADTGKIINYTNETLEGDFITVSREVFAEHRFDLKVKDGKIIKPKPPIGKIIPGYEGTPCHKQDVTIISQGDDVIMWSLKTYED